MVYLPKMVVLNSKLLDYQRLYGKLGNQIKKTLQTAAFSYRSYILYSLLEATNEEEPEIVP